MAFIPKPHEIYKHFKGNLYQIVTIAEHSETGECLVIYQALYGDYKTYARPLSMFTDRVDRDKYPDVAQEFRFELQGADSERQKADSDSVPAFITPDAEILPEHKDVPVEPEDDELQLDPFVLEFLDADSYEQRLNILAGLHHRITDDMITTMAIACDVEVPEGSTQERYDSLRSCLVTLERYECNRLRG
ncbi:MAG: DUF1653 domain-containing protein [Lachnospiraceae bacterium]|nr:DUF1653 domain-containing protein [Lachnospiraceae bacterium]